MTRPYAHRIPRAMRNRPARRLAGDLVVLAFLVTFYHYYVPRSLDGMGAEGALRPVLAIAIVSVAALPFALLFTSVHSTDFSLARVRRPAVVASLCALSALYAAGAVFSTVPSAMETLSHPAGQMLAAFMLAVVWICVFAYARRSRTIVLRRLVQIKNPADADELLARCRQALRDDRLQASRRSAVELNLASALIALSARGDRDDGLGEAYTILQGSLESDRPVWTFTATTRLVEAMTTKARRRGELAGYDDALVLLDGAAVAAEPTMRGARARALATRASSLMALGELAARDGDLIRVAELRERATGDAHLAVELAPAGSSVRALHRIALARIEGPRSDVQGLDQAIETCRSALRRLWASSPGDRAMGYLALADLLSLRAAVRPPAADAPWWRDPATGDRVRALGLYLWLCFVVEHAAHARVRIVALVQELRDRGMTFLPGTGDEDMGRLWRWLLAQRAADSVDGVAELAGAWAAEAGARRDVASSAEAHWLWIRAVVAESRGRVMEGKERALQRVVELAAVSADWLLRADRARDAAVALDIGRAVVLTERMRRDDLEQRLLEAGRTDDAARWRDACTRISMLERGASATEPAAQPARAEQTPRVSDEYAALADHERLLRELVLVPGFEDVDAPATYDDLREAALEGPLVYLAATARRGFAIVVWHTGEPEVVVLPALTTERADALARRLDDTTLPPNILDMWSAAQAELFGTDFFDRVIAPLTRDLARDAIVTLIPTGSLGQVPLHVAGPDDDLSDHRREAPVLRYAPNARVLLRAQRTAEELRGHEPRVLTAGVPDAPGWTPLPRAGQESLGVAALFDSVVRPFPASVDSVVAHLRRCTVWHFACHGLHDPAEPLDSALVLADGTLSLRMIFARDSARHRLAVLSACESAMSGAQLPNEVVNFPSALLQAGVAGVVCCHGAVDDDAAAMLVLAFFARFRAGVHPARALADAQSWLGAATEAELHAAFPDAYDGDADAIRPFAAPDFWALFSYWGA